MLKLLKKLTVKSSNLLIIFILLLALLLRLLGTHPGYPPGHPDESTIADSALKITLHQNFEPVGYYYGSLIPIVYAIINIVFFIPLFMVLILPFNFITSLRQGHTGSLGCIIDQHSNWLACITTRSKYYFDFLGRYDTAILGAITVIFVYILAKKLFREEIGMIAAFYTAVNYRHVLSSNFSLSDSPASLFALISVILSTRIIKNRSLLNYIIAGVGLGLAFSVKYFIYVVPTLLLCHLIAQLKDRSKNLIEKLIMVVFSPKLVLALVILIMVFIAINPFLIINHETALYQLTLNANRYGGDISFSRLSRIFSAEINLFPFYYLFKFGLGELMSFTVILGFLYALYRYTISVLIISSVALPFLFFFLILSGTPNVRNYASIIPFLLIFPAVITFDLAKTIGSFLRPVFNKAKLKINTTSTVTLACFLLTLTVAYPSLKDSFLSSYYFSKTNNYVDLLDWIVTYIPDNATLVKSWGVPFPSYKKINLVDWSPLSESYMSLEELKELDAHWVIISSESGTYISNLAWFYYNDLIKKIFFNDQLLSDYLNNSYVGLVTHEIGSYRVKEFTKSSKSLDPEFFVSEIPAFWEIKKDNLITSYKFDKEMALHDYSLSSGCYKLEQAGYIEGHNFKGTVLKFAGMNQSGERPDFSRFTLPAFNALENKWYTLSGRAMLYSPFTSDNYKGGFWRLDFYSNDNQILKTYVSKQLSKKIDKTAEPSSTLYKPQNLNAAGMAPQGTIYAKASFQSDECHEGQSYLLYDLQVFESDYLKTTNIDRYPYFYKELPKSFIWQLPL